MSDHAPASAASAELLNRRAFLNRLSLILSGLIGLVLSVPILAYLLTPLIRRAPGVWLDVGRVDQFQVGETVQVAIEDPSPLPWAGQTAQDGGLAAAERPGRVHGVRGQLHPPGLPGELAGPGPDSSSARATAGSSTPTGGSAAGPPPRRCRATTCVSRGATCRS